MNLSAVYDDVVVRIPLASPDLIWSMIRRKVADFCKSSGAWSERVTVGQVIAEKHTYFISGLSTHAVFGLHTLWIKEQDRLIPAADQSAMDAQNPAWRAVTGSEVRSYSMSAPDEIRIFPIPEQTGLTLEAVLAVYPSQDTQEVPDWLAERYLDAWVDGVCAELMIMPEKSWTNPALSAFFDARFEQARQSASVARRKSYTKSVSILRSSSFDCM